MTASVERAPPRLNTPAPYLRVDDAARAIAFYTAVFGATEVVRLTEPGGRVAHAELRMGAAGEASLMLSEEYAEQGIRGPRILGGTPVALQIYVTDVEGLIAAAVAAGATVLKAPALDPFGDYASKFRDPCGHEWLVAERVESIPAAEMEARFKRLMSA